MNQSDTTDDTDYLVRLKRAEIPADELQAVLEEGGIKSGRVQVARIDGGGSE